jgi:hypothetical protein
MKTTETRLLRLKTSSVPAHGRQYESPRTTRHRTALSSAYGLTAEDRIIEKGSFP